MTEPTLRYVYDPLCGWCYAAAPMVRAVAATGIPLRLHAGGLFAEPTRFTPDKLAYVRQADGRIAAMTGQVFGAGYLDGLLSDPATVFWSLPPIAAILAVAAEDEDAGRDILRAIQHAHYVDGRRVVERDTLADLAAALGIERTAFDRRYDVAAAAAHVATTRRFMESFGLRGYPSFVLETASGSATSPHEAFYGRPDAFVAALREAATGPAR